MATTVHEIMNPELFHVRPADAANEVARNIDALGITGAPVVGDDGHPLGVVTLRDCLRAHGCETVGDRMSRPAVTVRRLAAIDEAARVLAETGLHRLVVVDDHGVAVGMLSAVDVLRGLTGVPARHPATFPHYDRATGLVWSDDTPLALDRVEAAPPGPGMVVLVHGGAREPERVVWAEWTYDMRTRLIDMLSLPQRQPLARLLDRGGLRFRAASLADKREWLHLPEGAA